MRYTRVNIIYDDRGGIAELEVVRWDGAASTYQNVTDVAPLQRLVAELEKFGRVLSDGGKEQTTLERG